MVTSLNDLYDWAKGDEGKLDVVFWLLFCNTQGPGTIDGLFIITMNVTERTRNLFK